MKSIASSCVLLALLAGGAAGQCPSQAGQERLADRASAGMVAGDDIVQTAVKAGSFTTLIAAVQAAGLESTLKGEGSFTVFAPTDAAFEALPKGTVEALLKPENKEKLRAILTYHVLGEEVMAEAVKTGSAATVNGQRVDLVAAKGSVTVDGAKVSTADVNASNGVIHVIDRVLMPSDKSIVKTAVDAGQFKTLVSLVEKAGLAEALSGEGPFTVFAPTDSAFAKLPKATLESLAKPEGRDQLAAILKFHVVSGRVFSDAAAKGAQVATLEGSSVTTRAEKGKVLVNGATVVMADVDASNGVIHAIDTVIMPPPAGKAKDGK